MLGFRGLSDRVQAELRQARRNEADAYRLTCLACASHRSSMQKAIKALGDSLVYLGRSLIELSNPAPPSLRYS